MGELVWELRSVNCRGIEVSLRLPDSLRHLESTFRKQITNRFTRGRVDAVFKQNWVQNDSTLPQLNLEFIGALKQQSQAIRELVPQAKQLTVSEILRWPGAVVTEQVDDQQWNSEVLSLLEVALARLETSRDSEGSEIQTIISSLLESLESTVVEIEKLIPIVEEELKTKINQRIESYEMSVDPSRLEQEIGLMLVKSDAREEIDRFRLHLKEFSRVLQEQTAVGKRLGFLIQELNREINTLGSKSSNYSLNSLVVDAKVTIEQIREQIQNVE